MNEHGPTIESVTEDAVLTAYENNLEDKEKIYTNLVVQWESETDSSLESRVGLEEKKALLCEKIGQYESARDCLDAACEMAYQERNEELFEKLNNELVRIETTYFNQN